MIKHFSTVKTNSYYKARYINDQFPVIIFSHGLGGNRTQNVKNVFADYSTTREVKKKSREILYKAFIFAKLKNKHVAN